ncbi:MAG: M23 family metallopeptidase [Burkholderiaceae bacterium]|nr:M23 family metallopeptidase [Microbacteriaceae bacterium]
MSLPSSVAGPFRLSGLVIVLCLIALPLPAGGPATAEAAAGPGVVAVGAGARHPTWAWPVGPGHTVTHGFVAPASEYGRGHRGIDISAPVGATVVAPADGGISFVGSVGGRGVVSIAHADGVVSSIEPVDSDLVEGASVARGMQIGTVTPASTSHCTDCVHLGARRDGRYVSPLLFLGGIEIPVLLPTRRAG